MLAVGACDVLPLRCCTALNPPTSFLPHRSHTRAEHAVGACVAQRREWAASGQQAPAHTQLRGAGKGPAHAGVTDDAPGEFFLQQGLCGKQRRAPSRLWGAGKGSAAGVTDDAPGGVFVQQAWCLRPRQVHARLSYAGKSAALHRPCGASHVCCDSQVLFRVSLLHRASSLHPASQPMSNMLPAVLRRAGVLHPAP